MLVLFFVFCVFSFSCIMSYSFRGSVCVSFIALVYWTNLYHVFIYLNVQ